jgi:superfamily I DNA and/or RNA helicase
VIGFLSDERRMNVAITRAKFVLVIIGNSNTLAYDSNWSNLIDFMNDKNSYVKIPNEDKIKEFA